MQIVIDIPKDEYNKICSGNFDTDGYFKMNLKEAFRNAIPLPKGHRRLIDADALLEKHPEFDTYPFPSTTIDNAPTIIEADKEDDKGIRNLCDFCTNIGCEFQSGIIRTKCAFYMPPQDQYEARLKAERKKIAEDVADKMNYMGSCLNEKNVILGIITGKRETLDSLCPTCKSENCVSNGTAISKADYENRLKADVIAILGKIRAEIEELYYIDEGLSFDPQISREDVLKIIDKRKAESEEKDV